MTHLEQTQEYFIQYKELYDSKQINDSEYKSLLEGLEVENVIVESSRELLIKEQLNVLINATILAVSSI